MALTPQYQGIRLQPSIPRHSTTTKTAPLRYRGKPLRIGGKPKQRRSIRRRKHQGTPRLPPPLESPDNRCRRQQRSRKGGRRRSRLEEIRDPLLPQVRSPLSARIPFFLKSSGARIPFFLKSGSSGECSAAAAPAPIAGVGRGASPVKRPQVQQHPCGYRPCWRLHASSSCGDASCRLWPCTHKRRGIALVGKGKEWAHCCTSMCADGGGKGNERASTGCSYDERTCGSGGDA